MNWTFHSANLLAVARLWLPRSLAALGLVGILESRSALRRRVERLVNLPAPRTAGLTLTSGLCVLAFAAVAVPMGQGPGEGTARPVISDQAQATNQDAAVDAAILWGPSRILLRAKLADARAAQERGELANAAKLYDDAYELLLRKAGSGEAEEARQARSGLATVRLELARSAVRRGLYREAKANVDDVLRVDPTNAAALTFSQKYNQQLAGQIPEDTAPETAVAVRSAKDQAALLVQDGKLLYEMGKLDEAEAKLRAARREDPESQAAYYYLNLLREARFSLTPHEPAPYPSTNLTHTSPFQQQVYRKLRAINLDNVGPWLRLPLIEVVKILNAESRKCDPEQKGIYFIITTDAASAGPKLDPGRGAPGASAAADEAAELSQVGIQIDPPLHALRLADALDLIVKSADQPIKYSIEDYGILFSRASTAPPLYFRTIQLDPNKFNAGLSNFTVTTGMRLPDDRWAAMRAYFSSLGVDMSPPKALFYKDLQGILLVYATLPELDTIEKAVGATFPPRAPTTNGLLPPPWTNSPLPRHTMTNLVGQRADTKTSGATNAGGLLSIPRVALPWGEKLYFRTIKVDPSTVAQGLSNSVTLGGSVLVDSAPLDLRRQTPADHMNALLRKFFAGLGVNLDPPKTMFFNDREGTLLIYASLHDLDMIERAVQVLNITPPQINLKARFIQLPEAEINAFMAQYAPSNLAFEAPVRLTPSQARKLLQRWQGMDGVGLLSESQVTTLSGRQTQIQTVDLKTVVMGVQATPTNRASGSPSYRTEQVPVGPTLDIIPQASADGYAVQLGMIANVSEFLGYDNPGQFVVSATSGTNGSTIPITAQLPLPHFRVHQQTAAVSVWDGQSVLLGAFETVDLVGKFPVSTQTNRSHVIVLVTPTLIDAADNRYHAQDEMPFTETSFPPEAKSVTMPGMRESSRK